MGRAVQNLKMHFKKKRTLQIHILFGCLLLSTSQVTETTPLGENSCVSLNWNLTKEVLHNSSTVINEVGLANDSLLYKFIELKGKPGDSLKRYTLHFFFGNHSRPYTRIHLQGKFGSEGLFVVKPGPMFQSVKPDGRSLILINCSVHALVVLDLQRCT